MTTTWLNPELLHWVGHIFLLLTVPWVVYGWVMRGSYVSDDWAGILYEDEGKSKLYDGKLRKQKTFHNLLRYIRWQIGKVSNPDKAWKEKKLPEFVQNPVKHHRLSIFLFSAVLVLLYFFLSSLFGPTLAILTCILFAVHPIGHQTVAWMSGIGYLLSTFFLFVCLNIAIQTGTWTSILGILSSIKLFTVFYYFALESIFQVAGLPIILILLGKYHLAFFATCLALYVARGTVKGALDFRKKIFVEQKMESSTFFHFGKLVVMVKTLGYYLKLCVFPKRLGLYHTWGFHYELPYIEREDYKFWGGLIALLALLAGWILLPFHAQFSIVWFLAFMSLFSNVITVNQFVTERYCWIPLIGVCLFVSWLTQSLNLAWAYWLITGILVMRTWVHLPTYLNEREFYISNVFNFPDSEVARGNLGCAYLTEGRPSTALDEWAEGIKVNPDYDVNYYNLGATYRQSALQMLKENNPGAKPLMKMAYDNIVKAISCRTCHFPDRWKGEIAELERFLSGEAILNGWMIPFIPMPFSPMRVKSG